MYVYLSVCDTEPRPIPSILKITYLRVSAIICQPILLTTFPKPTSRSATNFAKSKVKT